TGSGKSTSVIIPNLVWHTGSLLCLDPKGELAMITAARRGKGGNGVKGLGQDVYILDPFGIVPGAKPAAYNVFDEMERVMKADPDRPVSYAGKIADALVKSEGRQSDPYWDNAARSLIRGLVLHILTSDMEERSLVTLRRLLTEGDVEEWKKWPQDI